jgi:Kef-type K+ transport system membrane component KefB
MNGPGQAQTTPGRSLQLRLIVMYAALMAATVAGAVLLIHRGQREHPQASIAGGYDLAQADKCFGAPAKPPPGAPLPPTAPAQPPPAGASFDVLQSGQFVNLTNAAGSLGGKLRLRPSANGRPPTLRGTVDCVGGGQEAFAGVATAGPQGQIQGTLAGVPIVAALKRDPPDPGTPMAFTPGSIAGNYKLSPRSVCFGGTLTLSGSGGSYAAKAGKAKLGRLSYTRRNGALAGDVGCARGGRVRLRATAAGLNLNNVTLIPLDVARPAPSAAPGKPVLTTPSGLPPSGEKFSASRARPFDRLVAAFFLAAAIVVLVARLFGIVAERIGQPRVMGEVVAGITLGPSVLGLISHSLQADLFPADLLPAFGVAANLGLIFYMFLVGLEIDRSQLRGRLVQAVAISNTSIAVPLLAGIAIAIPIYKLVAPNVKFAAFALFMGVAMSITAFPVLARILAERRMLKRPLGALVLTCAAIDDVVAWFLIALATTVAVAGSFGDVAQTIGEAAAFCLIMGVLVRPLIGRVSNAFDESGRVPPGWVAIIFAGVVLSAYVTDIIGIAVIFGGFIMGMVMPRNAGLTEDVTRRVEDFVVVLLLPLFFAYTGLQTNISLLDRGVLWEIALALVGVAIGGKLFGAAIAARVSGFDWRSSAVVGTLMNTRGLTELIVLNLALQKGAISSSLFAIMVLMALVTTFMAGPLLRLLDPKNRYGAPVEQELVESRERSRASFPALRPPDRAIVVGALSDAAVPALRELAEPLARSQPPRELILARIVLPPRGVSIRGGLQTENALVRRATEELELVQRELIDGGLSARVVAFTSARPGEDLARLAEADEIDLVLVDGRRPVLGEALPLVNIKPLLERAPSDVAVLMSREGAEIGIGAGGPVVVPFGGAEHDWSALELGAWLASASGAPLKLLGVAGTTDEAPAVRRRLDDAGMLVREFASVSPEPVVVEPGGAGLLAAADDARLLVVGLSERWKEEGLGETRARIARTATAPILFVRRGTRPSALAPREDFTRFGWSSAGTSTSA